MNDRSLMTIRLYDFRHYFATMRYIKYRDVPLTALDMGHKDWNTTSKYIHLARILELVDEDENYIVKTAETIEQAKELLENGFIFVQEFKGISIYRKRK
jgi:integrase